jgi:DNA-binding MarR family transcriptional regulator
MDELQKLNSSEEPDYGALAAFRYEIRRFLKHMEENVQAANLFPQDYLLLLAIKGLPAEKSPDIATLSEILQMDEPMLDRVLERCEKRGLISHARCCHVNRHTPVSVTEEGHACVKRLATMAQSHLLSIGPQLMHSIVALGLREPGVEEILNESSQHTIP